MTYWVFNGERRRHFDDWWVIGKKQLRATDDPKVEMTRLQGEIMLACLRAYEQGRIDEREDAHEIREEIRTTGRVRRASDFNLEPIENEERQTP